MEKKNFFQKRKKENGKLFSSFTEIKTDGGVEAISLVLKKKKKNSSFARFNFSEFVEQFYFFF